MLTRKQRELLLYIHDYISAHSIAPSCEEMRVGLGLRSSSGVHRLLVGLEERGFLKRIPKRARAIEILRLPETTARLRESRAVLPRFSGLEQPMEEHASRKRTNELISLPLYESGSIETFQETFRRIHATVDVPKDWLHTGKHFALKVSDDSMIEAGILNGDTAILRRCTKVGSGSIALVFLENGIGTLKRLRCRGRTIVLESANRKHEPRISPPEHVEVAGYVVAVFRRWKA